MEYPWRQSLVLNRRDMLRAVVLGGLGAALPLPGSARESRLDSWPVALINYLETHARPDGGYAWEGQERSHLTPTFAVVGCYHLLNRLPPRKAAVAEFIRTHHPSKLKKLEQEHRQFEWQQIQSLAWLGEDVSSFRGQVLAWTQPTNYLKQYERTGCPVFSQEVAVFACRSLLGLHFGELPSAYVQYLDSRRRSNGSFNSTPAAEGGDGHLVNTWHGLQALECLGRAGEKKECVSWLRACQLPSGGFTWQPKPEFAGIDDVAYTRAAVRALNLLGAGIPNADGCLQFLSSLANPDGGFADRPGWLSNPLASYYALDALNALKDVPVPRAPRRIRQRSLPAGIRVFSAQLEAHGKGSPAEAVDLADALKIHLWGAKNATPEWLTRAQSIADQKRVPVRFFVANEEYGTWVRVPGLGTYSHTSDLIAPAGKNLGASLAGSEAVSWPEFRERRLVPLQKAGGCLVWQFGENEELVRLFLDDSLERGGYAAISTFHFGNPDFTNSEPFLLRYRGQIPFVALQDAHGDEPWWFADMTTGFRTLFLATEPTWDGFRDALKRNWVVAVRNDAISGFNTWIHGGSTEVTQFVLAHEPEWRWWNNPDIARPMVSIVAVRPGDLFEQGRPEKGIALRVRCAFENTTQGRPKTPIAELLALTLDGTKLPTRLHAPRQTGSVAFADHYYIAELAGIRPGKHTAKASFKLLETGVIRTRMVEFTV